MQTHTTDAEIISALRAMRDADGVKRTAAKALGVHTEIIAKRLRFAKERGLTADTPVRDPLEKLREEVRRLKSEIKTIHKHNDTAEELRKTIYNLQEVPADPPDWLFEDVAIEGPGTPMTMWSDWHFGEVVKKQEVGGLNEFNSDIAEARVQRLVDRTTGLIRHHMPDGVPGMVVMLGGDMMTGDIHMELQDTNDKYVLETVRQLKSVLVGALTHMADVCGNIFVPCVVGNHGRNTLKPRMKGVVHCVTTDTPVLTRDLRWVPAGSLTHGQNIIGFDEHPSAQGRRLQSAFVTHMEKKFSPTIKVVLDDGTVLKATPEHKFVCAKGEKTETFWLSAEQLLRRANSGRKNKATTWIDRFFPVWEHDTSYEAGYLAAAFDGEGCLARTNGTWQLSFNQTENDMLNTVCEYLDLLGFGWSDCIEQRKDLRHKTRHAIYLRGGLSEIARFLGTMRPPRLLAKWAEQDISTAYLYKIHRCKIVAVEEGEIEEIASLSSSSATYITAGFASHNTSYEWNIYCDLEDRMRADERIKFFIPTETDALFSVHGHRFLLTHGDRMGVKGGDGIIGALGPIKRGEFKVRNSESQIGRDFDTIVMGHWHQAISTRGLIVNNCLKGYDEFARLALRAPATPASQQFWFLHPKWGINAQMEVYVQDVEPFQRRQKKRKKSPWVEVFNKERASA